MIEPLFTAADVETLHTLTAYYVNSVPPGAPITEGYSVHLRKLADLTRRVQQFVDQDQQATILAQLTQQAAKQTTGIARRLIDEMELREG